jgi:hypothetical protein
MSGGDLRGSTLLVVSFALAAWPLVLSATPSLTARSSPNPFPGLIDVRTDLPAEPVESQGNSAASSEETSRELTDPARRDVENTAAGSQPRSNGWRWEKVILFHFTNPASRPGIAASRAGQRLVREFDSGFALLTESLSGDEGAATPQRESLAGLGEDKAGFDDVPLNALPEPPPLVLFATGLACVIVSRAVRRLRKPN